MHQDATFEENMVVVDHYRRGGLEARCCHKLTNQAGSKMEEVGACRLVVGARHALPVGTMLLVLVFHMALPITSFLCGILACSSAAVWAVGSGQWAPSSDCPAQVR